MILLDIKSNARQNWVNSCNQHQCHSIKRNSKIQHLVLLHHTSNSSTLKRWQSGVNNLSLNLQSGSRRMAALARGIFHFIDFSQIDSPAENGNLLYLYLRLPVAVGEP